MLDPIKNAKWDVLNDVYKLLSRDAMKEAKEGDIDKALGIQRAQEIVLKQLGRYV